MAPHAAKAVPTDLRCWKTYGACTQDNPGRFQEAKSTPSWVRQSDATIPGTAGSDCADAAIDTPICLQRIACSAHTTMRFPAIVHSGAATFKPSSDFPYVEAVVPAGRQRRTA